MPQILLIVVDCSLNRKTGDLTVYEMQPFFKSAIGPHFDWSFLARTVNLQQTLSQLLPTDQYICFPPQSILPRPFVGGAAPDTWPKTYSVYPQRTVTPEQLNGLAQQQLTETELDNLRGLFAPLFFPLMSDMATNFSAFFSSKRHPTIKTMFTDYVAPHYEGTLSALQHCLSSMQLTRVVTAPIPNSPEACEICITKHIHHPQIIVREFSNLLTLLDMSSYLSLQISVPRKAEFSAEECQKIKGRVKLALAKLILTALNDPRSRKLKKLIVKYTRTDIIFKLTFAQLIEFAQDVHANAEHPVECASAPLPTAAAL